MRNSSLTRTCTGSLSIPITANTPATARWLVSRTWHLAHPQADSIKRVAANYTNFSNDGEHVIDGWEDVELTVSIPNVWDQKLDWYSAISQTGSATGSKKTGPDGFHLRIDVMKNILEANGTLTTTIDGVEYHQPANGT